MDIYDDFGVNTTNSFNTPPKTISMEMHDEIISELYQMRNLYLLRIQELIEDGRADEAIILCQSLIK